MRRDKELEARSFAAALSLVPEASLRVYTDGSSYGNPGPGGAGYAVAAGSMPFHYLRSRSLGACVTNNAAELAAILDATEHILGLEGVDPVYLFVDNRLAIQISTGRCTPDWAAGVSAAIRQNLGTISTTRRVYFLWVPGHAGVEGNEVADKLAKLGSAGISAVYDRVEAVSEVAPPDVPAVAIAGEHKGGCAACLKVLATLGKPSRKRRRRKPRSHHAPSHSYGLRSVTRAARRVGRVRPANQAPLPPSPPPTVSMAHAQGPGPLSSFPPVAQPSSLSPPASRSLPTLACGQGYEGDPVREASASDTDCPWGYESDPDNESSDSGTEATEARDGCFGQMNMRQRRAVRPGGALLRDLAKIEAFRYVPTGATAARAGSDVVKSPWRDAPPQGEDLLGSQRLHTDAVGKLASPPSLSYAHQAGLGVEVFSQGTTSPQNGAVDAADFSPVPVGTPRLAASGLVSGGEGPPNTSTAAGVAPALGATLPRSRRLDGEAADETGLGMGLSPQGAALPRDDAVGAADFSLAPRGTPLLAAASLRLGGGGPSNMSAATSVTPALEAPISTSSPLSTASLARLPPLAVDNGDPPATRTGFGGAAFSRLAAPPPGGIGADAGLLPRLRRPGDEVVDHVSPLFSQRSAFPLRGVDGGAGSLWSRRPHTDADGKSASLLSLSLTDQADPEIEESPQWAALPRDDAVGAADFSPGPGGTPLLAATSLVSGGEGPPRTSTAAGHALALGVMLSTPSPFSTASLARRPPPVAFASAPLATGSAARPAPSSSSSQPFAGLGCSMRASAPSISQRNYIASDLDRCRPASCFSLKGPATPQTHAQPRRQKRYAVSSMLKQPAKRSRKNTKSAPGRSPPKGPPNQINRKRMLQTSISDFLRPKRPCTNLSDTHRDSPPPRGNLCLGANFPT